MPQTPHVATHFTSSENIRDIVIGMSDGLTVPFALAAGLSGVVDSTGLVVTAGLAEVAAGAIAMGLGGYLAARTDAEHYDSEYAREERETFKVPEVEMEEVASIFRSYGLPETTVTTVAEAIRSDRRRWIEFMMKFELGVDKPNPARARVSALTIGHLHGQEADPQRLADGGRRGAGGRGRVRDCEVDCVAASIIIPRAGRYDRGGQYGYGRSDSEVRPAPPWLRPEDGVDRSRQGGSRHTDAAGSEPGSSSS